MARKTHLEASSRKRDCVLLGRMGDCYTEAPCEAMVMCGDSHWIMPDVHENASHNT